MRIHILISGFKGLIAILVDPDDVCLTVDSDVEPNSSNSILFCNVQITMAYYVYQ